MSILWLPRFIAQKKGVKWALFLGVTETLGTHFLILVLILVGFGERCLVSGNPSGWFGLAFSCVVWC